MAMNNTNYGYSPSGFSSPYSSTPTGVRTQRPRFGISGPPLYPRPRSSASKPNPDSFSDSMINNYGTSTSRIDSSFNTENGNSYNDSYNSSNYYTAEESFYSPAPEPSVMRNSSMMYNDPNVVRSSPAMLRSNRSLVHDEMPNSSMLPTLNSQFSPPKYVFDPTPPGSDTEFIGKFPKKKFGFGLKNNKAPFTSKFTKTKKMAAKQGPWRCELCSLDFTSQIPYDMHLRGARHAKKVKAQQALTAVQLRVATGSVGEKSLFCEVCNVRANSSLQMQTHLEGSKHKNKLLPKEPKEQTQEGSKETVQTAIKTESNTTSLNGKTNGSLVRPLPADFGEPQPTKLAKFVCDVCSISVNSEIQLQQHLSSKKHQNKLEGKPIIKGRRHKMVNKTSETQTNAADLGGENLITETTTASSEASTKVVGVKTLASSFVLGETLQ